MSWSVNVVGKPEGILSSLDKTSESLQGQSKEEFDAALPHLKGIVSQVGGAYIEKCYSLSASGHGYATSDPKVAYNHIQVDFKMIGDLV